MAHKRPRPLELAPTTVATVQEHRTKLHVPVEKTLLLSRYVRVFCCGYLRLFLPPLISTPRCV
jgi:hypothetical protein